MREATARPEQTQSHFTISDTVRTVHSSRIGSVTHVYPDGSASVRWHDKRSDALDLGHERLPHDLLVVIDARSICVDALRRAATAPTVLDALDIAGAALAAVVELSCAEVCHA